MKTFVLLFLGLACVGCSTTTYRTTQGTELHEEAELMNQVLATGQGLRESTQTLLANGAVALGCPKEHLRVWSVLLHRASIYLVDGCGWRASYLRDCRPEYPKGDPGPGKRPHDEFGADDPAPKIVCQLEIIGKVELPRPAPEPSPAAPAPAESKPSPAQP
jgi:hypothetical protein